MAHEIHFGCGIHHFLTAGSDVVKEGSWIKTPERPVFPAVLGKMCIFFLLFLCDNTHKRNYSANVSPHESESHTAAFSKKYLCRSACTVAAPTNLRSRSISLFLPQHRIGEMVCCARRSCKKIDFASFNEEHPVFCFHFNTLSAPICLLLP